MNKIMLLCIGCMILLLPYSSYAFEMKKGQNCTDCHKLTKSEASIISEKFAPGGVVLDIKDSPIQGLWQVYGKAGKEQGSVYIDYSKKYLITEIIPIED